MYRVSDITDELEALAPRSLKEEWDNVGLMVGDVNQRIETVFVCLDITSENVHKAVECGADMIISHHPLIFHPLSSVTESDAIGRIVRALVRSDISAFSMHTNFDKADGGMNDRLAEKLGLQNVRKFTPDECAEPSGKLLDGIGRVGTLEYPMLFEDFMAYVRETLGCRAIKFMGNPAENVQTVALCSGSGGSNMYCAYNAGADAYVTADLNHHHAQTARELGLNIIDAGHFETENIICEFLGEFLSARFPELNIVLSDAKPFFES